MPKPWILIAAACGIAAVVFVVTLLVGPPAPTDEPIDASQSQPELPTGTGVDVAALDAGGSPPIGVSKGGEWLVRHNTDPGDESSDTVWTLIQWEFSQPKPDGVVEVTRPRTRTYLGSDRVMTMEAEAGTFVAPENNPKSGELAGNVVLRIYKAEPGREASLAPRSPDLETVVYLEEASFNLELAQIDSRGPVHVTGRELDFHGRGLSLNHNQLRDRLERLEIKEGDVLRFRRDPNADAAEQGGRRQADASASRTRRDRREATSRPGAVDEPAAPSEPASPELPPTSSMAAVAPSSDERPPTASDATVSADVAEHEDPYYRATFEKDVRVTSGGATGEAADITADTLAAIFSMGGGRDRDESADSVEAQPDHAAAPASPPTRPRRRVPPDSAEGPAMVSERSMMVARDDDVIIRWTGRLLVEPLERKPRPMAGPDDMLVTLAGNPVEVRTGREETVIAREVTVLASVGRIEAKGDADELVLLQSPQMGTVAGTEIVINQALANGHVKGPGWLKGRMEATVDPAVTTAENPSPTAEGDELEVAWTDRLDLTFHRTASAESRASATGGALSLGASSDLAALRTAVFRGEVLANHPRFHLGGDTVSLALDEPKDGRNTLQAIESQGNVQMAARGQDEDEQFDLASQQLRITMEPDEQRRPSPRRVAASGDVVAHRPNMELKTQQLAITLVPVAVSPTGEAPAKADAPKLAVDRLVANGAVEVRLIEEEVTLKGDRLAGEMKSDQLELFGSEAVPARVVQPEGTLVGQRIVFGQESQTVRVEMPGHIVFASLPEKRRGSMRVDWSEAMRFSNRTGLAVFTGGVQTNTESPTDRSRLTAQTLDVQFEAAPPVAEDAAAPAAGRPQQVKTAVAKGDVRFRADRFVEGKPDDIVTRFSLQGPEMSFDNTVGSETVYVIGAGRMGLVDHRPREETPAAAAPPVPAAPAESASPRPVAVSVSGRGATLFEWTHKLTMNAARNDLTLEGNVRMTHRPAEAGSPIFFDADRIVADLEEPEGEVNFLDDRGPQPEVRQINADGNVVIRRESLEVLADHLVYREADRTVVLTADPGGQVQVRGDEFPVPLLGGEITWNLATNTWNVGEATGTVIPHRAAPRRRPQR